MNQHLDPLERPAIRFEGEFLPQSLHGISILIDRKFSECTAEWIWRLSNCLGAWKEGGSDWCTTSATEIIDHLLDNRDEISTEIGERLGSDGFDGQLTMDEWLWALARIRNLAETTDGICRWVAGEPSERAEEQRRRILAFLDKQRPSDT